MEGRVEAGDLRHGGKDAAHRRDAEQGLGLVERREVGERGDTVGDRVVDQHRVAELGSAVDDPVPDGLDPLHAVERSRDDRRVAGAARRVEVARGDERVVLVEHAQLDAARAGVDGEDAHLPRAGPAQPAGSSAAASSPARLRPPGPLPITRPMDSTRPCRQPRHISAVSLTHALSG